MFTCRILTFYFGSKVAIVNKLVTGSSPPIVSNLDQLMGQGGNRGCRSMQQRRPHHSQQQQQQCACVHVRGARWARTESLLGEGGFGRVYRGREGVQGNHEFVVEVLMLSQLHHPNLVNLVGYCADGQQCMLVYKYMALGSLAEQL
jgi:hypothetical protein